MSYTRFAIYYLPTDRSLAGFGATWLGWDVVRGIAAEQLPVPGLADITERPRAYGFHATLKPPFILAKGRSPDDLHRAITTLVAKIAPARCDGLRLATIGGFLALTPLGDPSDLDRVAASCVTDLDPFRARATASELARRRSAGLSARQDALLKSHGYPYVLDQFRFHLTLTSKLPATETARWQTIAQDALPPLPAPFVLDQIALVGQRADGFFQLIQSYPLTG